MKFDDQTYQSFSHHGNVNFFIDQDTFVRLLMLLKEAIFLESDIFSNKVDVCVLYSLVAIIYYIYLLIISHF